MIISLLISSPSSARTSQLGITKLMVDNHTQRNFVYGYIVPTIEWRYQTYGGYFNCRPCVDDIDNDGKLEILFGQGGYYGFYWLGNNGSLKWVSQSVPDSVSSVVAADVDGDGQKEIVLGSYNSYVYCLNSTGGLKWSFATGSPITPALVIAKVGGGVGQKIFAESDNYTLYCLNGTGGLQWKFNAGGSLSPPVVADLNEDGKPEIVLFSSAYDQYGQVTTTIYCLNETGALNWSRSQGPSYYNYYTFPPVVFNGDGSGKPVIVVGSYDGNIYCLNGNGSVKSIYKSPSGGIAAVGNIDTDSQQEVVIPSGGSSVLFLDGIEGVKYLFMADSYLYSFSPGIADMDGNLRNEVVVAGSDNNLYCGDTVYGLEWKFYLGDYLSAPPSFADLNADGRQEIVVAVGSNSVYCIGTALSPLTGGNLGGDGNPGSTFDFNFLLISGGAVFLIAIMGVVSTIRRRQVRASMRDYPIGRDLRQETESVRGEAAPISTPRYCHNCGAEVSHPDSLYCFNCGVRLGTFPRSTIKPIERAKIEPRVGGKCMVCGSNVESSEPILYCPHCGNAGHRAHLLQWIHLRNYCPMCGSHLNEGDLKDEHTGRRLIIRHS